MRFLFYCLYRESLNDLGIGMFTSGASSLGLVLQVVREKIKCNFLVISGLESLNRCHMYPCFNFSMVHMRKLQYATSRNLGPHLQIVSKPVSPRVSTTHPN